MFIKGVVTCIVSLFKFLLQVLYTLVSVYLSLVSYLKAGVGNVLYFRVLIFVFEFFIFVIHLYLVHLVLSYIAIKTNNPKMVEDSFVVFLKFLFKGFGALKKLDITQFVKDIATDVPRLIDKVASEHPDVQNEYHMVKTGVSSLVSTVNKSSQGIELLYYS